MDVGQPLIFGIGAALEHHVPTQTQIRRVELQHESRRHDGLVLSPHGFGERMKVLLMVAVIIVGLKERDHTRRRRVHERFKRFAGIGGGPKVGRILAARLRVFDFNGADAHGSLVGRRASRFGLALQERRVFFKIGGCPSGTVACETGDAMLDIGGVTELAHLAVAHHVDTDGHLAGDHLGYRCRNLPTMFIKVDFFVIVYGEDPTRDCFRTRQAADMGGQDVVCTGFQDLIAL